MISIVRFDAFWYGLNRFDSKSEEEGPPCFSTMREILYGLCGFMRFKPVRPSDGKSARFSPQDRRGREKSKNAPRYLGGYVREGGGYTLGVN